MAARFEDSVYVFSSGAVRVGDMSREQLLCALETEMRTAIEDRQRRASQLRAENGRRYAREQNRMAWLRS